MNEAVSLLKFNSKVSSKEKIVHMLSEQWPLSSKEILEKLKKEYSHEISYQGAHKSIVELAGENILEKEGSKYKLNKNWAENNLTFFHNILNDYKRKNHENKINKGFEGTVTWVFESYSVTCVRLAELFISKDLVDKNESITIAYMRYGMWPLNFNFKDFIILMKFLGEASKGYPIIKNKTPLGEWVMTQYKKAGAVDGTFDPNLNIEKDMIVNGDCIIEIEYEKDFLEYLDKSYKKIKNIAGLFKHYTTDREPPTKITVKITKNTQLSKFLIEEAMKKYFEVET